MPVSASTLKMLIDGGFAGDALVAVVAAIDADMATSAPSTRDDVKARSGAAIRQERYRHRKASDVTKPITRDVTRDVTDETPSPTPPTSNPTPLSPLKGTVPPFPESQSGLAAEKSVEDWVEGIWDATPTPAKRRSSKRDLQRAMVAAVRRGQPPGAIAAALRAYYASPDATKDGGEFAKGVHRLVQEDRWAPWSAEASPSKATDTSAWPDERWASTLSRWRSTGHWPAGIGPPPDDPETSAPVHLRANPLLRVIR